MLLFLGLQHGAKLILESTREKVESIANGIKNLVSGSSEGKAEYYESTLPASLILKIILDNDAYIELPCMDMITDSDFGFTCYVSP